MTGQTEKPRELGLPKPSNNDYDDDANEMQIDSQASPASPVGSHFSGISDDGDKAAISRSFSRRRILNRMQSNDSTPKYAYEGDHQRRDKPSNSLFNAPTTSRAATRGFIEHVVSAEQSPQPAEPEINSTEENDFLAQNSDAASIAQTDDWGSTEPPVFATDGDHGQITSDFGPHYELRPINREVATTYLDQDNSGNFDPEEEKKKDREWLKMLRQKRKRPQLRGKPATTRARLRFSRFSPVLRITGGDRRRAYARSSKNDSQEAIATEPQAPILDPLGEFNDLTGHPVARGCVQCRQQGGKCSMIEDRHWPCDMCRLLESECQPIVPSSLMKTKCDRCTTLGAQHVCSFETQIASNADRCDQCDHDGEECVAPVVTTRCSIDDVMYSSNRKHIKCTNCRANGKRCSLKTLDDTPPCKNCVKNGIGCTFYDVEKASRKKKSGTKGKDKAITGDGNAGPPSSTRTSEMASRVNKLGREIFSERDLIDLEAMEEDASRPDPEPTPKEEMEDCEGHRGVTEMTATCFAHPVSFLFDENDENNEHCNWCTLPAFGFFGHFELQVFMLRWCNGRGFSELGGGHREIHDATVMCSSCVIKRVQVVTCENHIMEPIAGVSMFEDQDMDEMTDRLLEAPPGSFDQHRELERWCSLCVSPAKWSCGYEQVSLEQEPLEQEEIEKQQLRGCGLRLCRQCHHQFEKEYSGDLEGMISAMDSIPKANKDDESEKVQIRADVGLLLKEGMMMANVDAALEENDQMNCD